nr:8188_t:CDS:2 [Entrophospora candida]CAG8506217.1 2174_t:CDS:2 [Entrophospora candida]
MTLTVQSNNLTAKSFLSASIISRNPVYYYCQGGFIEELALIGNIKTETKAAQSLLETSVINKSANLVLKEKTVKIKKPK